MAHLRTPEVRVWSADAARSVALLGGRPWAVTPVGPPALAALRAEPHAVDCVVLDVPAGLVDDLVASVTGPDDYPTHPLVVLAASDVAPVGDPLRRWLTAGVQEVVFEDAGEAALLRAVTTAIERHAGQLARRAEKSRSFYQLIRDNPFGVYLVDHDLRVREISLGAQAVFANVQPVLGRDLAEVLRTLWPEPFATEAIGHFRATLATGAPFQSPRTVERRNDTRAVEAYDWRIERITLPDGRPGVLCYFYDLSERQRMEEELRTTLDSLPDLVFVHGPDGAWEYVSASWSAYTGAPREALLGVGWLDAVHPDDRERVRATWSEAVATARPYDFECRFRRADGGMEWFKARGRALRGTSGEVSRWVGTALNVDDLKRTQSALVERQRDLHRLADNIPDIVTRFDREYRHRFINAAVQAVLGRAPEVFLGRTNRELGMPSHLCDRWEGALQAVFDRRAPQTLGFTFDDASGPRDFEARLVPEIGLEGRVDYVLGITTEVTARNRAAAALRASEEHLRLALRAADAGAWDWDIQTGSIAWSPENYALYGMDEASGPLAYATWRAAIDPRDIEQVEVAVQQALDGASPEYRAEFRVPQRTGEARWLLGIGRVQRDGDGRALRMSGINLDITERKLLEEELAHRDRRKDEFLATLAHELRNPLAPISNGLMLLKLAPETAPASPRVREMMERQLGHLIRLVDDLLDVSRIAQGKLELKRERVDLERVLAQAVEASRALVDASNHTLVVVPPAQRLVVDGDPTRLVQVVSNLLNNAAKYTPRGGRIALSAERAGREALVTVRDSGVGIAPEMLHRVFDLFMQADTGADRAQGGLGIGLSLVRRLVELHGGAIEAHSEGLGHGCRFVVRLPLPEA